MKADNFKKKIYIENYGCTANKFDLEIILSYINQMNYEVEDDLKSSDIIIINTCGVKKPTEDKIINRLRFYLC